MNYMLFLIRKKLKIIFLVGIIIICLGMVSCTKNLKPWDNPELVQVKTEGFEKYVSDVTWHGNAYHANGKEGAKFKIYFNADGYSELWVHTSNKNDIGRWRIDENNNSLCTYYKNLRSGQETCYLVFRVPNSNKLEYYYMNGKLRGKIREVTLGDDM